MRNAVSVIGGVVSLSTIGAIASVGRADGDQGIACSARAKPGDGETRADRLTEANLCACLGPEREIPEPKSASQYHAVVASGRAL
jgi:hypothetical protein